MNGWMDMFQDISDEVSLLFTRQNFPRQGPAKDRCFNGAPCFFNWPCWSLSTCCFKKSTVWRPFVASWTKKTPPTFCVFCKREIRCLFWGWKESKRYHPKKSSRSEMSIWCFFIRDIMFVSVSMRILKTVFHWPSPWSGWIIFWWKVRCSAIPKNVANYDRPGGIFQAIQYMLQHLPFHMVCFTWLVDVAKKPPQLPPVNLKWRCVRLTKKPAVFCSILQSVCTSFQPYGQTMNFAYDSL